VAQWVVDAIHHNTELATLRAKLERAKSFDGVMDFLRDRYPSAVFDGSSRDAGAMVAVLTRKLADAERDVALGVIERKLHNVHQQKWLKEKIEAEDESAAAIARVEAAESEAHKARSVCEEIENYAMTANQSILDNEESIRHQIFDQIRDIARKGCTKCFSSGTYCELQEMKSENDELRREVESLKKQIANPEK